MAQYLNAREATRALGISAATLYAYVSRGLVRSRPGTDHRSREYSAEDIERLRQRRRAGRGAAGGAAQSLDWGLPVLDTRISTIRTDGPWYRGRAAVDLVTEGASLEDVARRLWDCEDDDPFAAAPDPAWPPAVHSLACDPALPPLARAQAAIPLLALDSARHLSPEPVQRRQSAAVLTRQNAALLLGIAPSAKPLHRLLAEHWCRSDPRLAEHIRAALVLCADHELNASSFTARVVASTGASLHASVTAGMAALSGPLHGGATARAQALIRDMLERTDIESAVLERWQRGEPLPGFGHPLYPHGDPRGTMLLDLLRADVRDRADAARLYDLVVAVGSASGSGPTLDFGLAAIAVLHDLPGDAALTLFAAGRIVGWLAHAIEQQAQGARIRPRARYIGP